METQCAKKLCRRAAAAVAGRAAAAVAGRAAAAASIVPIVI